MKLVNLTVITIFCLKVSSTQAQEPGFVYPAGTTIKERFKAPQGYKRIENDPKTFSYYLQSLSLKPVGEEVHYYNGSIKANNGKYIAVVDMEIGKKDLQQCADAVIRLRAEYLYKQKKYSSIHFNFISDGKPRYYTGYIKGDYSYKKFREYCDYIFMYANTGSLLNELKTVNNIADIRVGDVFIQKGKPFGHAVIVVDVAVDGQTGKKMYLLAQSYMPAQEIHVLQNPMNKTISPWYEVSSHTIYTPEWTFVPGDLRRFKD